MKKNNYYTATNLNKYTHGFFSKIGGVSKGIYTSLNCGLSSNDKKENVITNKKIIADTLNFNIEELIIGNQFHSNKISIIKDNKKLKYKCDGIICLSNNIALGVLTADCCPILIGHKNKKLMGVIHLGWKGLFDGIIENFSLETSAFFTSLERVYGPRTERIFIDRTLESALSLPRTSHNGRRYNFKNISTFGTFISRRNIVNELLNDL